jgi:secreted trypsin-like serine protease
MATSSVQSGLKKLGLLAAVALSASVAQANMENLIIGGVNVESGDPVLTSTILLYDGNYLCTGSLIAPDLIVSAAHCVLKPINLKKMRVYFTTDISSPNAAQGSLAVVSAIANPNYAPNQDTNNNDISVIKIDGPLPSGYAPAQLMSVSDKLQNGQTAILAGFGESTPGGPQGSNDGAGTLREVQVQIENADFSPTEVLVNQTQGRGACHGDSGGPAFIEENGQLLLWGVTSRAYPDNQAAAVDCDQGSVYTDILEQAQFVDQAAQQLRGQSSSNSGDDNGAQAPTGSSDKGGGSRRHKKK